MQDEGFQLSAIIHDSAVTLVDVGDVGVGTAITHLWQPQGLPDPDMIAGRGTAGEHLKSTSNHDVVECLGTTGPLTCGRKGIPIRSVEFRRRRKFPNDEFVAPIRPSFDGPLCRGSSREVENLGFRVASSLPTIPSDQSTSLLPDTYRIHHLAPWRCPSKLLQTKGNAASCM